MSTTGRTLHEAENAAEAKLMVESVKAEELRDFVLSIDEGQCTALHKAADHGKDDVVKYICSLFPDDDELLFKRDCDGCTALHCAGSKEVAIILLQSVSQKIRRDFVLLGDNDGSTALHTVTEESRIDVVEYLCNLYPGDDELILKTDDSDRTALHYASTIDIAKLLVESVRHEKQQEFLLTQDAFQYTALHLAVHEEKHSIVDYLCGLNMSKDELILAKDFLDCTALHYAEDRWTVEKLVGSVTPKKQRELVTSVDACERSPLHIAVSCGRTDVVQYYCSLHPIAEELIFMVDCDGKTALHDAENIDIAEILMSSTGLEKQKLLLMTADETGCTVLHTAAGEGRIDVVNFLCSFHPADELIAQKTYDGRTALHCAKNREIAHSIVESIRPERRKDFVLSVDNNQLTPLHSAAAETNDDVVEYICSVLPTNEGILIKDGDGRTALHYAQSRRAAESLVNSVEPNKQKEFVMMLDDYHWSALTSAAAIGNSNVVEYLCSFIKQDDFILNKDFKSKTALHYAKNKMIAQHLVESITPEKQKDFLTFVDEDHCTALHRAAENGRSNIVEYICSLYPNHEELLLKKDKFCMTVLHYARNREVAEHLVKAVAPEKRKEFLSFVDDHQSTVLHLAASSGAADIIKYLCGLCQLANDELVLSKDCYGNTALHYAVNREIGETLVKSVTPERKRELILSVDENQFTVLHNAAIRGRTDIVEYLCDIPQISAELILVKAINGYTALHYAKNGAIAKAIINVSNIDLMQVLSVKTSGGDTPILTLARFGRYNALKEVFQQLEQLDSDVLMSYLLECNDNNQNILHLIALSPTLEDLSLLLKDFFCSSDIIDMMYPDIYGNTPIHYVAAKYATKTFADFMLNLPLAIRKSIADASNVQLTDCRRIIYKKSFNELFYVQKVLCDESNKQLTFKFNNVKALFAEDLEQQLAAPENAFKYDEDILRVLKYSLNEYSLLDSAYKTSNFLFSSAFNSQRVTVLSNEAYRSRKLLVGCSLYYTVYLALFST